jgi:hypothetical protein
MTRSKTPPLHFGQLLANRTLDWLPTDTKENYEKLIQDPANREYFARQGWDQPGAITYNINSHGFRSDEFDGGPYMVALGCSYTAGIGLPNEDTWAQQTAAALGLKCANLSWGGYSADSCYRLAEYWIPELDPEYVCMLVPPKTRLELLLDESALTTRQMPMEVFMPASQSMLFDPSDNYLKHWFLNEENAKINQRKNILAIRQLCADLNIPCTILNAEKHMRLNQSELNYARDAMHGGPKVHDMFTVEFVNGYTK